MEENGSYVNLNLVGESNFHSPRNRRQKFFVFTFGLMISILVVAMAFLFSLIYRVQQAQLEQNTRPGTLETAFWETSTLTPSLENPGHFDLTVISSIGNLRRYPNIRSFGISNGGQKLAISTDQSFSVVDLRDNSSTILDLPFAYVGDSGEALSWSDDDQYIAFTAISEPENPKSQLIIIKVDDASAKVISENFAYSGDRSNPILYPAKFSPLGKFILTRVFDGDHPQLAETSLIMYDTLGNLRKEIIVRAEVPQNDQIVYMWDDTGRYVYYLVTKTNKIVNYANLNQFIKVLVAE